MFFGEGFSGGGEAIKDATIDPSGFGAVDIDGDSLFPDGDKMFGPFFFDEVIEEGSAVPGRIFLGESEVVLGGIGEFHNDLVSLGGDVGKLVATGDIRGVRGVDSGLHGGDLDGDVWHVELNEIS